MIFLIMLSGYTTFCGLWSSIRINFFQATSGKLSFTFKVLNYAWVLVIISNLTVKQRYSIVHWSSIYGVLQGNSHDIRRNGYCGLNRVTTPSAIAQPAVLHLRPCMVYLYQQFFPMFRALLGWRGWAVSFLSMIKFCIPCVLTYYRPVIAWNQWWIATVVMWNSKWVIWCI